jgi:HSP20 family protein
MHLTRYNPTIPSLLREFDQLFRDYAVPSNGAEVEKELMPPVDIVETDKAVELHLDMPGLQPDAIDVKLDGKVLTISAERKADEKLLEGKGWVRRERRWGTFSRSFTLPDSLDNTTPEATYKHGVLTVTLPRKEPVAAKAVKVNVTA